MPTILVRKQLLISRNKEFIPAYLTRSGISLFDGQEVSTYAALLAQQHYISGKLTAAAILIRHYRLYCSVKPISFICSLVLMYPDTHLTGSSICPETIRNRFEHQW